MDRLTVHLLFCRLENLEDRELMVMCKPDPHQSLFPGDRTVNLVHESPSSSY